MDILESTITSAKRVILSVGSGDGSQQASIVNAGHHNIIATFFDSEQVVTSKYGKAQEYIELLRDKSTVLFGVDATKLHDQPELKDKTSTCSHSLTREYPIRAQRVSKATNN